MKIIILLQLLFYGFGLFIFLSSPINNNMMGIILLMIGLIIDIVATITILTKKEKKTDL